MHVKHASEGLPQTTPRTLRDLATAVYLICGYKGDRPQAKEKVRIRGLLEYQQLITTVSSFSLEQSCPTARKHQSKEKSRKMVM